MAELVTAIGARLSLLGREGFIRGLEESTAAVNQFADAWERAAVASDAAVGKTTPLIAAQKDAAKASEDAAKAEQSRGESIVTTGKAADEGAKKTEEHTQTLKESEQAAKKAAEAHQGFADTIGGLAGGPVGKLGKWSVVGALGTATGAMYEYMKFNRAMTQVVTQAGISKNRLPALSQGVLNISASTGRSFTDVANQLYRITSASGGLHRTNSELLSLTKQAANLAMLGNIAPGAPTEQVARIFGAMSSAGLRGAKTPKQIGALMNAVVGTGDIRMQDLIGALGRGLPTSAKVVGASAPDTLAWVDLLTSLGQQGSTAGTYTSQALMKLATGSQQETNVQAMMGIPSGKIQNIIKHQGIGPAAEYLDAHMKKFDPLSTYPTYKGESAGYDSAFAQLKSWENNPQVLSQYLAGDLTKSNQKNLDTLFMSKMFGGARQGIPATALLEFTGRYNAIRSQIGQESTQGRYNKDLAISRAQPSVQWEIGLRTLQKYLIELGAAVTPMALAGLHAITDAIGYLGKHTGLAKVLLGVAGSIAVFSAAIFGLNKVLSAGRALKTVGGAISKLFGGGGFGKMATAEMNVEAGEVTVIGKGGIGGGVPGGGGSKSPGGGGFFGGLKDWGVNGIKGLATAGGVVALGLYANHLVSQVPARAKGGPDWSGSHERNAFGAWDWNPMSWGRQIGNTTGIHLPHMNLNRFAPVVGTDFNNWGQDVGNFFGLAPALSGPKPARKYNQPLQKRFDDWYAMDMAARKKHQGWIPTPTGLSGNQLSLWEWTHPRGSKALSQYEKSQGYNPAFAVPHMFNSLAQHPHQGAWGFEPRRPGYNHYNAWQAPVGAVMATGASLSHQGRADAWGGFRGGYHVTGFTQSHSEAVYKQAGSMMKQAASDMKAVQHSSLSKSQKRGDDSKIMAGLATSLKGLGAISKISGTLGKITDSSSKSQAAAGKLQDAGQKLSEAGQKSSEAAQKGTEVWSKGTQAASKQTDAASKTTDAAGKVRDGGQKVQDGASKLGDAAGKLGSSVSELSSAGTGLNAAASALRAAAGVLNSVKPTVSISTTTVAAAANQGNATTRART